MFDQLRNRMSEFARQLRGRGRLSPERMGDALEELRSCLLEADVALPVCQDFLERVRARGANLEVVPGQDPGRALLGVVQRELLELLGPAQELRLGGPPPRVFLLAGLQGSGKTTSAAKLAAWLKKKHGRRVLLAGVDVHRPAAMEQLRLLAERVGVECYTGSEEESGSASSIARGALEAARRRLHDFVVVDSAGRLHVDEPMMRELVELRETLQPRETLLVVDSMQGQDALQSARAFAEALPLTGLLLTKVDGDARGGAALSARAVTGCPIKFLGVGETPEKLEVFRPERLVPRLLGGGDLGELLEVLEDQDGAAGQRRRAAKLVKKPKGMHLGDLREQLRQLQKLGGVQSVLDKLPAGMAPAAAKVPEGELRRMGVVIDSMTPGERRHPEIINPSRKRRIAAGSGTRVQDVNHLLKQFRNIRKNMRYLGGKPGRMGRLMTRVSGRAG